MTPGLGQSPPLNKTLPETGTRLELPQPNTVTKQIAKTPHANPRWQSRAIAC